MGSYIGNTTMNNDLIPQIKSDIENKLGITDTGTLVLRHLTIYGNDGDQFEIDGHIFEIKNGVFSSPTNDNLTLLTIRKIVPKQSSNVTIYYLR